MDRPQRPAHHRGGAHRKRRRGAPEAGEDRPELSFELVRGAREDLERYLAELARWGARTNLVGSTAPEALAEHVRQSLAAVPFLRFQARVVDVGSGAGFPGIPIAIARPDLEVVLVERRERRVHFLRHVVRTLGLSCAVRRASIEAPPDGPLFDAVLMRGVAPARDALRMARGWAAPGGELWLWTREAAIEESEEIGSIPLGSGGRIARLRPRDV